MLMKVSVKSQSVRNCRRGCSDNMERPVKSSYLLFAWTSNKHSLSLMSVGKMIYSLHI